MSRILFAALFGIIILGISLFTAKMFQVGLRLHSSRSTTLPAIILPLSFIASFIASRSVFMGPVLYTVINALSGIAFFHFLGSIVLGLALLVALLTGTALPLWVAWTIFGLSIALGILGIVQARMLKVVDYTVTLKDAPLSWNGKTAVLVADTHFGLVNHKAFSDKIVKSILSIQPDFVLHAGDFYDGPKIPMEPITESWSALAREIPVFYAPGNHEGYGNYGEFIASVRNAGIAVLEDSTTTFDGITIAGLTYRGKSQEAQAKEALSGMALPSPSILINHPPNFHRAVADAGISLMVSGHTHNGQFWPINYLVRRMYGKYTYGMQPFESLTAITTSGVGTYGPPLRLFNTPELVRITFSVK